MHVMPNSSIRASRSITTTFLHHYALSFPLHCLCRSAHQPALNMPELARERSLAHQLIGSAVKVKAQAVTEQVAGHVAELDTDLGAAAGQRLARLEQERHAIPARVVYEQRHRRERRAQAASPVWLAFSLTPVMAETAAATKQSVHMASGTATIVGHRLRSPSASDQFDCCHGRHNGFNL